MPNATELNKSQDDVGAVNSVYQGISQESFTSLNDEQKNIVLNGNNLIHEKEKDSGSIGKLLGANPKNAAIHFAFIVCAIILVFCFIDLIQSFCPERKITSEVWDALVPIITLALGYVFGRGSDEK